MIKVLIVDDSVVYRKIVSQWVKEEPDMEVAAIAASGKIALAKMSQCNPDVVLLDVSMPEMDGIETLERLQESHPKTPVIMFSSLTRRGAAETLEALSRGAADYLAKPTAQGPKTEEAESTRDQLLGKIRALLSVDTGRTRSSSTLTSNTSSKNARDDTVGHVSFDIVAIGGSTGGPAALTEIVSHFAIDFPIPIVIVQHMPAPFTGLLAQRLNDQSPLHVFEATDGAVINSGSICIAAAEHHLVLKRESGKLIARLTKDAPVNSCRPSVDVTFASVLDIYKNRALAVILTGMGKDGSASCASLFDLGARVIAQDKESSVVWGMPGHVVERGKANRVLPLSQIGLEINRLAWLRRSRSSSGASPRGLA